MCNRGSEEKLGESEYPRSASVVKPMLAEVTIPVPNRFRSLPVNMLDTIVESDVIIVKIPRCERGTASSPCIMGQAAPRSESGKPSAINPIYMIASKSEYIFVPLT